LHDEFLKEPEMDARKKAWLGGFAFGYSQGMQFIMYVIAFRYGGELVNDGTYTFEDLIVVIFAVLLTAIAMGQSAQAAPEISKAKPAISRVFRIIDRPGKINGGFDKGDEPKSVDGSLTLSKVTFAYPSRKDITVFNEFDLDIKAGQTVALCGPSGSGKSTIVSLTERFYDLISGSITLDKHNIRNLNVRWLRNQIGFVQQEPNLITGTIAENIAFGMSTDSKLATQEQIEEAAKSANAHDFIMEFPQGYQTVIDGNKLSGGQKQRVAIARALIRDPSILLLDEATSALDNKSERVVQDALDDLLSKRKRTSIVIAHRLSTIQNADNIVVVDNGRVLEQGTHDELLKKEGTYAKLYNSQLLTSSKTPEEVDNESK